VKKKRTGKLKLGAQKPPIQNVTGKGSYGQQGANAAAKRNRIKISGLDTRTRGHVSARGKRSQAHRDTKH
jgi:hypothetical protein